MAAVVGAVLAGPVVVHVVLVWIGHHVAVPLLLGRVPDRAELGRPRARCRRCAGSLAPLALPVLPVLPFGARCRRCGEPLRAGYGAIELACGAASGALGAVVGWAPALVPMMVLVPGLVAASVTDLVVMRIPTRFVRLTLVGVGAGMALVALTAGPASRLGGALVGMAVAGGSLLVVHLASPAAPGLGDVRLGGLVGAAAGWSAWRADRSLATPVQGALHTLLVAGLVGTVVGIVLLAVRRRDLPFPFGPALAVGGLAVCLATGGGS